MKGKETYPAALLAALLSAVPAVASAGLIIERIEPANNAIVFIVEPATHRKFQAYEGAEIGAGETLQIDGGATRVTVRDPKSGQVTVASHDRPLPAPPQGPAQWLQTRWLDLARLNAQPGSTQSARTCAARPTLRRPDIPLLIEDDAQLSVGAQALALPLSMTANEIVSVSLLDPKGRVVETSASRGGYWISQSHAFEAGRYQVRLTDARGQSVDHSILATSARPAAPPAEVGQADPATRALWLATSDEGRWRLAALQVALETPLAQRSEALKALIQALGRGVRLDRAQDLATCFG